MYMYSALLSAFQCRKHEILKAGYRAEQTGMNIELCMRLGIGSEHEAAVLYCTDLYMGLDIGSEHEAAVLYCTDLYVECSSGIF